MSIRALWDRVQSSLYFVPGLFIALGAVLAVLVNRLDAATASESAPFLLPTSVAGARTLLASIAGATITVAALIFSMTALTVQLASSQYSPRVLDGFLRDRAQQIVIGIVVGTFTFSLVSLAIMGSGVRDAEGVFAAWATTFASVFAIATVIAIVFFVDHITRRLRVENIVKRIADDTTASMAEAFGDSEPEHLEAWEAGKLTEPEEVFSPSSGWVQRIDVDAVMASVPEGAVIELKRPVGTYVLEGDELARVWLPERDGSSIDRLAGIDIGGSRTALQDPGFGLRQLTDIALRALSPGVNDPATAADAVRQLSGPILVALLGGGPRRSHASPEGTRLLIPDQPTSAEYLRGPFSEIRHVSAEQPLVLRAMAETLTSMRAQLARRHHESAINAVDAEIAALRGILSAVDVDGGWNAAEVTKLLAEVGE